MLAAAAVSVWVCEGITVQVHGTECVAVFVCVPVKKLDLSGNYNCMRNWSSYWLLILTFQPSEIRLLYNEHEKCYEFELPVNNFVIYLINLYIEFLLRKHCIVEYCKRLKALHDL